ncbi:MAG TPA: hypothetical protein GXX17_05980 [Clostridiales bacterium]|nr:hypothetical protein [Clostridiales bacterium]
MHKDDLIKALDTIKPDEAQKSRMLNNVFNPKAKENRLNLKLLVPACVFAVTILGTAIALPILSNNSPQRLTSNAGQSNTVATADGRDAIDNDLDIRNPQVAPEFGNKEDYLIDDGRDILPVSLEFTLDNRQYRSISDFKLKELGLSREVNLEDIGKYISTIKYVLGTYVANSLEGREVYEYIPAGCQAIVAVKTDEGYDLYEFAGFTSYIKNSDEDAVEYLKVYNIKSADDISKIVIGSYSNDGLVIDNKSDISKFYDFFKYLKNSSDEYFNVLYNSRIKSVTPPDGPVINQITPAYPEYSVTPDVAEDIIQINPNEGGTAEPENAVSGATGVAGDLLGNSRQIKIYTASGLYYETVYYPNIKFISRFRISEEFSNFLNSLIS